MFETLLVPLDGTPQSNVALPFARVLAQTCQGRRMLLMRVVDPAVLAPDERGEQAVHVLDNSSESLTRCATRGSRWTCG